MNADDDFDFSHFLHAQAPVLDAVRDELAQGRKRTHWMWFMFPQLRGLGHSEMARRYALASRAQARAYLRHPVLGARLVACVEQVLAVPGRTAHAIFGSPDDLKLHSCLSLFAEVAGAGSVFERALDRFFEGRPDAATHRLLDGGAP